MHTKEAKKEYTLLTKEELKDLNYTGDWDLDQKRFIKEYEKNMEIFYTENNIESLLETDYDGI